LIGYKQLSDDSRTVLDKLVHIEKEVNASDDRWFKMHIQPYRTILNVIEGVVVTFSDITEAKKARELVKLSEKSYRSLFDTVNEGIIILDVASTKIINANPYIIKLLGYSKEELIGKSLWQIGFLEQKGLNKEKFVELIKEGEVRYEDLPLETATGESIEVEFISNTSMIIGENIVRCNIRDISTRKKTEHILDQQQIALNFAQQQSSVGNWSWDVKSQTTLWSDEMYSIYDIKKSELEQGVMSIAQGLDCYDTEKRHIVKSAFEKCSTEGIPYDLESRFTTVKGEKKWVRTFAEPVFENKEVVKLIGFLMDITDRKRKTI